MNPNKIDFSGKRMLVVEDDPHLRETVAGILRKLKADVSAAENGVVAKSLLEVNENSFDIVLSDIQMPEMDGILLLAYCKGFHKSTKVVIFTGFSELLATHTATELGADGFLMKPFRLAELVEMIHRTLMQEIRTVAS